MAPKATKVDQHHYLVTLAIAQNDDCDEKLKDYDSYSGDDYDHDHDNKDV